MECKRDTDRQTDIRRKGEGGGEKGKRWIFAWSFVKFNLRSRKKLSTKMKNVRETSDTRDKKTNKTKKKKTKMNGSHCFKTRGLV